MLLINELDLKGFKAEFNKKKRRVCDVRHKFDTLKKELAAHLEKKGKTLRDLQGLNIYDDRGVLCFYYTENTGVIMTIRLLWKVSNKTEDELNFIANSFYVFDLKGEPGDCPRVEITDAPLNGNYGLYWPQQNKITLSIYFINGEKDELIESVLKHEVIHAFLYNSGKDARDTSDDFIKLIIEHNAFVSLEEEAQKAYENFKRNS